MNISHRRVPYTPYRLSLTPRARELRKEMTQAERVFWNAVRNRRFLRLKFIRQKPLLDFIADFYCAELRLVVEIDGSIHEGAFEYDRFRTLELESLDLTVIRYTNDEVLYSLDRVLFHLFRVIQFLRRDF